MLFDFTLKIRTSSPSSASRISAYRHRDRAGVMPMFTSAKRFSIRHECFQVSKHTVFSMLSALKVCDAVCVLVGEGVGRKETAILTLLVGYNGLVSFFVILVGGTDCIGAYLIKPVCDANGMPEFPFAASPPASAAALFDVPSTIAGTFVPAAEAAVTYVSRVDPVMPVRVKRSE